MDISFTAPNNPRGPALPFALSLTRNTLPSCSSTVLRPRLVTVQSRVETLPKPSLSHLQQEKVDRDTQLKRDAQTGCKRAMSAIFHRYRPAVMRYLKKHTAATLGEENARDLCQECFATVFLQLQEDRCEAPDSIKQTILRAARQVVLHHLRAHARKAQAERLQSTQEHQVSQAADLWIALSDAMEELSPAHREILELRQQQGLSYSAIAESLGIRVGTVKSRLNRSRSALLNGIEDHLYRVPAGQR